MKVFFAIGKAAHDGADGGVLEGGAEVEVVFGNVHGVGIDDGGDGEIDNFIAIGFAASLSPTPRPRAT